MRLTTDRRTALKAGGIVLAGLAAPQLMIRAARAETDGELDLRTGINHFQLGTFDILTIQDGERAGEGPHPIFGEDRDAEEVAELMEENFLPADRFVNGFTPVLVNTGDQLVLFDTGLGAGARQAGLGQLRARLQAAGHAPEDVDIVILTHFHGDHIGGLMEDGEPAFPNARYATGQVEYDFWTHEDRLSGDTEDAARSVQASVVPLADNITFLADGDEVVPGVTAMEAFGHTPGHMIFHIESEGQRLMLTADTANHYVASLLRPDWHVRFDMDKEQAAETRRRVFDMIASERIPFTGYHMPFPSLGFVEALDNGYRYVPATYQFAL